MTSHLLHFLHSSPEKAKALIKLAIEIKQHPDDYEQALVGKSIIGLFEKPSLRTRVSLDIGINKLGGHFVYLDSQKDKLTGRESVKDMAANLSCWADGIVARVFSHSTLEQLAEYGKVPVLNALCDLYHPCQALADYISLYEVLGEQSSLSLAYIGDGNNVAHSLMILGAVLGVDVRVITPEGYEPDEAVVAQAQALASQYQGKVTVSHSLDDAQGVDALYTDTWISMGEDKSEKQVLEDFSPFQLTMPLMEKTGAKYVMHCQPAHRDQEISSELMDSKHSLLMRQAENRMYAQGAILLNLLKPENQDV